MGKRRTEENGGLAGETQGKRVNRNYVLSIKQWIRYGGMAGCIAFGTALIFYQNLVVGCIAAGCAAAVYPLYKRRDLEAKQQQKIALEFKECLYGLVAALRSGPVSYTHLDVYKRQGEMLVPMTRILDMW